MLRVDYERWDQTPADLRHMALNATHNRTRERLLALHDIAQGACATQSQNALAGPRKPSWTGCTATMTTAPRRCPIDAPVAAPLCPEVEAALGDEIRAARQAAAT